MNRFAALLDALLFTPSRYLCHGCQQAEAYVGFMAPSPYITSAASFATADFLRRVTTIAYRTRELQLAWPGSGIHSAYGKLDPTTSKPSHSDIIRAVAVVPRRPIEPVT